MCLRCRPRAASTSSSRRTTKRASIPRYGSFSLSLTLLPQLSPDFFFFNSQLTSSVGDDALRNSGAAQAKSPTTRSVSFYTILFLLFPFLLRTPPSRFLLFLCSLPLCRSRTADAEAKRDEVCSSLLLV